MKKSVSTIISTIISTTICIFISLTVTPYLSATTYYSEYSSNPLFMDITIDNVPISLSSNGKIQLSTENFVDYSMTRWISEESQWEMNVGDDVIEINFSTVSSMRPTLTVTVTIDSDIKTSHISHILLERNFSIAVDSRGSNTEIANGELSVVGLKGPQSVIDTTVFNNGVHTVELKTYGFENLRRMAFSSEFIRLPEPTTVTMAVIIFATVLIWKGKRA